MTSLIETVDCFDCSLELPRPLLVGSSRVTHRSYAIVRIRTADGLEGVGYAFGRGLPVAAIVRDSLAPVLVGSDASVPEALRSTASDAYWSYAERGLFAVAASAVDLAVWDLLGTRIGSPLADILGKARSRVPVCGVGGYVREGEDAFDSLQGEMQVYAEAGCRSVKITIGSVDPAADARRVAAVREVVGPDCAIVVDAFRSFVNLEDGLRRLRLLEPFDLAYVEDPFSDTLAPLLAELGRRSGMLIGAGESLAGHRAYREIIDTSAVDVVRCDATVVGGVREFMAVAALASARGLEVSTHVHPEVHVHFAAAVPNLHRAGLEYMAPELGLDVFHELTGGGLEIVDGDAEIPTRPGLGLDIDWSAVERYARG